MKKILIVEDDPILNETLSFNLTLDGYQVTCAHNGLQARRAWAGETFPLVLLDSNLPDASGPVLCRELKARWPETYVVFLTANDREEDFLEGYEAGGSDYITKPFSMAVLSRKLTAIFQSMAQRPAPEETDYDDGVLTLSFSRQTATLHGQPLSLTPKEYQILALFTQNPRQILTKDRLLAKLWDDKENFVDEHALTSAVSRIRKKIETGARKYIKTAYGMGYQWMGGERR